MRRMAAGVRRLKWRTEVGGAAGISAGGGRSKPCVAAAMHTLDGGGKVRSCPAAAGCSRVHGLGQRVAWRAGASKSDLEEERCDAAETVDAVESADEATLQLSHDCADLPTTARHRRSRLTIFSSDTARTSIAYCGMPPLEAIAARREDALMLFSHFSTSSSWPSTISYSIVSCCWHPYKPPTTS